MDAIIKKTASKAVDKVIDTDKKGEIPIIK